MIKINLLGEETAVDHSGGFIIAGYFGSLVLLAGLFMFMYSGISASVESLTTESQQLDAQLVQLKTKTKEVHELEAKRAELRDKLAVIATLKRNKTGPVRMMDDLNKALPERAWLTEVKEREGSLSISGYALDNQTIVTFMKGLEGSDYFNSVDLMESKKAPWKGVQISQFSIDAKVNYAGKVAAAPAVKPEAENTGGK